MSRHGRHGGHGGEIAAGIGLASLAGIAGGTYKFAEFLTKVKRLHDVGGENAVFVRISENVRNDLRETERLLHLRDVKEALRTKPSRVRWIQSTIGRVRSVLEDMDKYTGRVDEDVEKRQNRWFGLGWGTGVKLRHRLRWVLDEHEKLDNRTLELSTVHQSLMSVMEFLAQFENRDSYAEGERRGTDRRVEFDVRRESFDEGFDEPRGSDTQVYKERTVYERDGADRDMHFRGSRGQDFVEGRRIEMVDRDVGIDVDAEYGYAGGDGPRRSSHIQTARRAYDFDEEEDRIISKTKRVYEYDEPRHHDHHGAWVRKKHTHEHDVRGSDRDREVIREKRVYHEDDRHGREKEVSCLSSCLKVC